MRHNEETKIANSIVTLEQYEVTVVKAWMDDSTVVSRPVPKSVCSKFHNRNRNILSANKRRESCH